MMMMIIIIIINIYMKTIGHILMDSIKLKYVTLLRFIVENFRMVQYIFIKNINLLLEKVSNMLCHA